ncbi:MAG TPA: GNAT family N-acetyltransferase [Puia sp.]|nr:GNAT family N-acetyltransferase [Puia sp.]
MIIYRPMQLADIPAGISLCRANRWNQLPRDFEIFLRLSPNDCRVAVKGDKITGSVTTLRYQKAFSWIGMLLVDPQSQRQGIGMQLLREALHILDDEQTVKLDATPAGREVYLKMGFKDEYHLTRMQYTPSPNIIQTPSLSNPIIPQSPVTSIPPDPLLAKPIDIKDLPRISSFDKPIFGAGRHTLLNWTLTGAPDLAFVVKQENKITGYCLGREGHSFTQIGPIVTHGISIAKTLLLTALTHSNKKTLILDIPRHTPEWHAWLTSIGFTEQRPFIRMYRGSNTSRGIPEKQFAILGPEFG